MPFAGLKTPKEPFVREMLCALSEEGVLCSLFAEQLRREHAKRTLLGDWEASRDYLALEQILFYDDEGPEYGRALHVVLTLLPCLLHHAGVSGDTVLGAAARHGRLAYVPEDLLTSEALCRKGAEGNTALHVAAKTKHIDQVPVSILTRDALLIENDEGETPLQRAIESGCLNQIPPDSLDRKDWLCPQRGFGESQLFTFFHEAAGRGVLSSLPPCWLDAEAMGVKDANGRTPVHLAAAYGHTQQIPLDILRQGILVPDYFGRTPLHFAASVGKLSDVPEEVLTAREASHVTLLRGRKLGSPLHWAAGAGRLSSVPGRLLTEESLSVVDHDGDTALDRAVRKGFDDQVPRKFRHLLKRQ